MNIKNRYSKKLEIFTPFLADEYDSYKKEFMEDEKQVEDRLTREDQMIIYYKENQPIVFQDLMEKFDISELNAKVFLDRIKNKHIIIPE